MSELKPCQKRAIDILWAEVCSNQQPLHCTRKELTDAVQMAEDAIRRAQPANEPLTLDELRGMDGEPVKIDDDGAIFYGIVSLSGNCFLHDEEVITLADGNFYLLRDMDAKVYPVLYRRKPEGMDTP